MELENNISEDEENINESEKREEKNHNKRPTINSYGTNNDENINNMNKEAKRIDSFTSFGLKLGSSKNSNMNNEANRSESENHRNKEYEYSSDIKASNKKPFKGNIQLILSGYLLEIIIRNKEDMNIIFRKQEYKNLLEDMKRSNNYLEIYKPIQEKDKRNLSELISKNIKLINKPLLISISSKFEFELEFYKHGKTFKNPIRKRYGILTNDNFYSSNEAIGNFKVQNAKNKTKYIINAREIIKENYNEIINKKEKWHNEIKKYRIKIIYMGDDNNLNNFLIYFFEEEERDKILEIIELIKLNLTKKEKADKLLKNMEKLLKQKSQLYFVLKALLIKRKLKNKSKIWNYLNKDLKKDKSEFDNFIKSIKNNIKDKYLEQRKLLYTKGIQRINKSLFLNKKFLKNNKEQSEIREYNFQDIKKACNTIYTSIKKSFYFHNNKKRKNDLISFRTKIIKNDEQYNKESNLCFNYNNISINNIQSNFINNDDVFMYKNKILEISSIIYNFNIQNSKEKEKEEYKIAILGPYNNKAKDVHYNNFSYDLKISENEIIKNINNRYIYQENEVFCVIFQIFNIEISKVDFKNYNFISSISVQDFFYLKIIGGFDNNLIMKTKIFSPKFIKDNKIVFELNIELYISSEFFDNKNREINIILYKINQNKIKDLEKNMLYLDYINQTEIKRINLKLDSFNSIPSYGMLFNECSKSKIFWNLIIMEKNIGNNCYIDKSLKIGNKFYYLKNIKDIENKKYSLNYYKYEKIDRFLQNIKDKENNDEILCLCEYIGTNENKEIIFYNISTDEYESKKYESNKFIIFNNNSINIINNTNINNFNNDSSIDFIKSHKWYKIISFQNETQMLSFLEIIKKLHRLSIHDYFYNFNINEYNLKEEYKNPYGHKINENLLFKKLKEDDKSKNNFRIILEFDKLELKNYKDMDKNSDMNIEILSGASKKMNNDDKDINTKNLNLYNIFMNNARNYDNEFITKNAKLNSLKVENNSNGNVNFNICYTNKIKLSEYYFKNNKIKLNLLKKEDRIINFDFDIFNNDLIIINLDCNFNNSTKHMHVSFDINQDFFNSFLIKQYLIGNVQSNGSFNFNDIYADYLLLPIFVSSSYLYKNRFDNSQNPEKKIISGILGFKIICFNGNPKYINNISMNLFEKINDKFIKNYLNYCLNKKNEIIKKLGIYEPNIYKNYILSTIIKLHYYKEQIDINKYLDKKGIIKQGLLPDLIINKENNSKYYFNKFKKYLYKYKENIIYNIYLQDLWERILKSNKNNALNIFNNFPSKEELINLYKANNNLFYKIKDLLHLGIPNLVSRRIIWDKLLNINDLLNKTGNKLSHFKLYNNLNPNEYNKKKGEIYSILNEVLKNNEKEEYLLLIDNIIELNVLNIKSISNNLELIKRIAIMFYQWTLLNIGETSEANAVKNVSEIRNINEIFNDKEKIKSEYSYYCGVLYLCEKLFKYFNSLSDTFWYLVGLSQVIPMFNMNYNSYELTIYNLVIKLIIEQHHPELYKKLISLNFPIEYFFSKHIASFYSSFFDDIELFIKIMDILIFESVTSIHIYKDPINHLRFLCTIILTIFVENEEKIMSVDNVFQLEKLFEIIGKKRYNTSQFLKKLNDNIYKYFNNNENEKEGIINNNWENLRIKIEKILAKNFYSYVEKLYSYMQNNFKKMILKIQNNELDSENFNNNKRNIINISAWKKKIKKYLNKYSFKEESLNNNQNKTKTSNRGILMIFREITIFYFSEEKIDIIGEADIKISEKNNLKFLNKKVKIDDKGKIISNEEGNDLFCLVDYKYNLKDENFLIISLYKNEKEQFKFKLNIDSINLFNPIRLEIHSYKSFSKSSVAILELSIMKYYNFVLNDDYSNLYLALFSPNEYKIDNIINYEYLELKNIPNLTELICEEKSNLKFEENLHKNIYKIYHQKLSLIYQYYLDRNFLCSNKKFETNKDDKLLNETKNIIKELFFINEDENYYIKNIINLLEKDNKFNNITIMEILISLYLDNDIFNINMNDILYNLYNFTMFGNKKNICTISNVVELVYIIYKKYSIFYEYKQVKNMVNYFFKKENFSFIKSVLICNIDNKLKNMSNNIYENEFRNKFDEIKKIDINITSQFLFLYNNFSEICEMFDFYNKSDFNPQSKINIILILKIILYDIFLKNESASKHNYNLYNFIIIKYIKEFTYEDLYFSFKYNPQKKFFDVEFFDLNNKYGNLYNVYLQKKLENKSIYELILLYANSNFLFNNINNEYLDYNISFEEFKNVFNNLPYLNDILFKNIYRKRLGLISYKNIRYDKISIYLMINSKKIFEIILISNSKNKNYIYNSNFTRIYNSIIINYNIYSNFTIKKIYDIIINNLEYQNWKNLLEQENYEMNFERIKESILDYNNISFYTINENKEYNYLEPLLPLYIHFPYTSKNIINFHLDITYAFFLKVNCINKYKGYFRFPQHKTNDSFQWRKCLIYKKKNDLYYKIIIKSLQSKRKLKNINIKSIYNESDNNKNKNDNDIVVIEDIGDEENLIIFQ